MTPVLHTRLPFTPWLDPAMRRLPGIQPAEARDAFCPDEAYAGQMALRDRLLADQPGDVVACLPEAEDAAGELLDLGLEEAAALPGFEREGRSLRRPDGKAVTPDRGAPLASLGQIFQQDFCLLADGAGEPVLTGAVLCFPAGWTLREKLGRPLMRIHRPVARYDADIGARVERLFMTLKPGRALWRANALAYDFADLFAPRGEADPPRRPGKDAAYIRAERQTLFRLPKSRAVVFAIHTIIVRRDALTPEQVRTLPDGPVGRE